MTKQTSVREEMMTDKEVSFVPQLFGVCILYRFLFKKFNPEHEMLRIINAFLFGLGISVKKKGQKERITST